MKFLSLSSRNLKEIYRDPVSLLLGLLLPVVMLVLFSTIQQNIQLELFTPQALTPGIIIFCYSFLIMFAATLMARDRKSSFLIRLFTTPLRPSDYILSYLLPFIPIAFFQAAICMLVGVMLGGTFTNILGALLIFFLFSVICISLGMILGSLFTVNQVSGIGSLLVTFVGLFSGVWMDLKMIGGAFEAIGYALPFAHSVDAAKVLLAGGDFQEISANFYVSLIYAIGLFVLAVFAFRHSMKRV